MVAVIYSFFFLFTEFPCQSLCPLAFQHKIKETDRKRAREHRWTFRICGFPASIHWLWQQSLAVSAVAKWQSSLSLWQFFCNMNHYCSHFATADTVVQWLAHWSCVWISLGVEIFLQKKKLMPRNSIGKGHRMIMNTKLRELINL